VADAPEKHLRLGVPSFINTEPLICGLDEKHSVIKAAPSRLVEMMDHSTLDAALVPVYPLLVGRPWRIAPGIAITSDGPVRSVALYAKTPPASLVRIACDAGSVTSVNLLAVLFQKKWRQELTCVAENSNKGLSLLKAGYDGVLLIGDAALRAGRPKGPHDLDLGMAWQELTGLPFVYAVWAVREGVDAGPLVQDLFKARQEGLARLDQIAAQAGSSLAMDAASIRHYLLENIHYELGEREIQGLELFGRFLAEMGCIQDVSLRFLEEDHGA